MNPFFTHLALYTAMIGIAVILGGVLPILGQWNRRHLPLILSLTAGLMLGSAFFHLIPRSYELLGKSMGIYVLLGFLFLFIIERYITVHICEIFDCQVHHLSISAFLGIAIHSLTDGIALGSGMMIPGLGFVIFLAVIAHKAPEVFSLSTVLLYSKAAKSKILLSNLLVLLMVPLGALLAYGVLSAEGNLWVGRALGFSAGTFLHISLSDLLPEAHRHIKSRTLSIFLLLLGLALMGLLENHFHLD